MDKRFIFLSLLIVLLGFISYKITYALLSSAASNNANTFASATAFPTITGGPTSTLTPTTVPPSSTPTPTLSNIATHIVISEIQITGGSAESNNNDFVELYNPLNTAFNLKGYRLVKRTQNSASDSTPTLFNITSDVFVPAHGYYLWAHKSLTNNFADTIFADASSSATLASDNSVALKRTSDDTIIDAVGWGSTSGIYIETSSFTTNPTANHSIERKASALSDSTSMSGTEALKGNGFDTDNNSTDFVARNTPQPQNSTTGGTELP